MAISPALTSAATGAPRDQSRPKRGHVSAAPTIPAPAAPAKRQKQSTVKPGVLSIDAACAYLGGLSRDDLYDLAALGRIVLVRRGPKRTFALMRSLDEFLESLPRPVINLSRRASAKRDLEAYEKRIAAEAAAVASRDVPQDRR
jgi:hypothetical protein